MKTYAIRGARTKLTGHLRQDGTRTTYCNQPVGIPNGDFNGLTGWKMCTRCVKAEARDRAEATVTATAALDPATAGTLPAMVCVTHGSDCTGNPKHRHEFRPAPRYTTADENAAAKESRQAADRARTYASVDAYITRTYPALAAFRAEPTAADRAAAAKESRQMAELITEAEADTGTWRGQWIGDTTALFDRPIEQGSLFA